VVSYFSWSYGSWIYNYLCNQCLSPLMLWVRSGWGVQHYVITFVGDLRQVGVFVRVVRFPPPIKLAVTIRYNWNIVEKVALSIIKQTNKQTNVFILRNFNWNPNICICVRSNWQILVVFCVFCLLVTEFTIICSVLTTS
jgi:hypothetical protein